MCFLCVDCGVDTSEINEYYMVTDAVWRATGLGKRDGMLCIGCLETRLNRRLAPQDFPPFPINSGFFAQSTRLRERLAS